MRLIVLALFFLCLFAKVYSQKQYLEGKVLETKTNDPIIFATIRIKGRALGVISNQDGGFRLPQEFRKNKDTIMISCMGYQSQEIALSDLSPFHINIVKMSSGVIPLSEAVVTARKKRKFSARGIVRRAVNAIPDNYPNYNFSSIGYYRDYQLDEDDYVNLNEAILNVFDAGFRKIDSGTTQVRIYEYRQNSDFRRDSLSLIPYDYKRRMKFINNTYLPSRGGNEFSILRVHDPIRNYKVNSFDFINEIQSDLLDNHSFKRIEDTYLEDEVLYGIVFNKETSDYNATGTLYIGKNDFSIHKLSYLVYAGRKKIRNQQYSAKQIMKYRFMK